MVGAALGLAGLVGDTGDEGLLFVGLAIAAPVGPTALILVRRTLARGWPAGLATGLGAGTADAIYGLVAVAGLSLIGDFLMAEQAFRQEALLNPRLEQLAQSHRRILSLGVVHFFEVLGSQQPEQDAKVLTAIILQMEYQGLLDGVEHLDTVEMRAILTRYLYLVLGL